jgi:hypothetical protein
MVVGAAVLLFARRPRERALRVLALPVASWAVWFGFLGHRGLGSRADQFHLSTLTGLPTYVWTGLSSALGQAFNLQSAGAAILVGLGAWAVWHMRPLWREKPALLGLCAAAVVFYVLAGLGRDALGDSVAVSRYVYVAIAVLVPVIAGVLSSAGSWPGARLAAVTLLAVTALGNVGQAQSYLASRDLLVDSLKADVAGTAQLLASGVRDVAGPGAEPIMHEPNLDASGLAGLARSGLLPHEALSPAQLVNARTLLAVSLSSHPLSSGRFKFLGTSYAVPSRRADGCMVFSPQTVSPPVQVWLGLLPGEASASVHVSTAPSAGAVAHYLAGVIVPASGPATTDPAELAVPPRGSAYVNYNDPGARLALLWNAGAPLTFCGLAPAPAG